MQRGGLVVAEWVAALTAVYINSIASFQNKYRIDRIAPSFEESVICATSMLKHRTAIAAGLSSGGSSSVHR